MPSARESTESMEESLESPFLNEEVLAAEPRHDFAPKIPRLGRESVRKGFDSGQDNGPSCC